MFADKFFYSIDANLVIFEVFLLYTCWKYEFHFSTQFKKETYLCLTDHVGTGAYSIFDEMGQSKLFFILYGCGIR